jgi:outer membrane PBP1 activator LpoA protein
MEPPRVAPWLPSALPAALLAGCAVIPKGAARRPAAPRETAPRKMSCPRFRRHRVALLVPLTGPNAAVGQAIANATTMALLDTNAQSLRITTYDTGTGAGLRPAGPCSTAIA